MPVDAIVPPPATTDQVGVNCTTLPAASRPTAVNCCVAATASVTGVGTTVIVASGPAGTVMEACPEMEPTDATTVFVNTPVVGPAVNIPPEATVPPPAAMDHVGVIAMARPSASYPTATICCVPPTINVALGVTVMLTRVPGSEIPCTSHAAANATTSTAARSARTFQRMGVRARRMRSFRLCVITTPPAACVNASMGAFPYLAASVSVLASVKLIGVPAETTTSWYA